MVAAVSMRDVARLAGVSVSTVSNVVNKPAGVDPALAARVTEAIAKLGFVRNDAARQLRTGRSETLGLVVLNLSNPFFADLATGVEDAAKAAGYSVLLATSSASADGESGALDLFERHRVDGVLVASASDVLDRLDQLRQRGIPAVLIDGVDDRGVFSSVSADDVTGGRLAAAHLIGTGRKRLLFVGGTRERAQMRDRLSGCQEAVGAASGVTLDVLWVGSLTADLGVSIGADLAARPEADRPDAVFAANDMLALGLIQGLVAGGLRVPDDIAVIGYDDIVFAAAAGVPLSSVRQPSRDMGERAAAALIEQLQNPDRYRPIAVSFEPSLVVRGSSAPRTGQLGRPAGPGQDAPAHV
jgi:LacI family transcriptional regulator